jgi:hypothetical protein
VVSAEVNRRRRRRGLGGLREGPPQGPLPRVHTTPFGSAISEGKWRETQTLRAIGGTAKANLGVSTTLPAAVHDGHDGITRLDSTPQAQRGEQRKVAPHLDAPAPRAQPMRCLKLRQWRFCTASCDHPAAPHGHSTNQSPSESPTRQQGRVPGPRKSSRISTSTIVGASRAVTSRGTNFLTTFLSSLIPAVRAAMWAISSRRPRTSSDSRAILSASAGEN